MALSYDRSFKSGRGSELLYNEELHQMYEAYKHLLEQLGYKQEPVAKLHGAQWHKMITNELKWYDKAAGKWRNYYENKFKIIENIMSLLPPTDPVPGELWIHQGVLCYYDGQNWVPIKALIEDGTQFSLDVFRNFVLVSPLWSQGNTVVDDADLAQFYKARRQIGEAVLDGATDSHVTGDGTTWTLNNRLQDYNEVIMPLDLNVTKAQMLVPYVDIDRIFLDHDLDLHKYEKVSEVCIQYTKTDLIDVVPSAIHMNPGRLTKITKRLIKIDRMNPRIQISAENTEFYGFHANNRFGDLLRPDHSGGLLDYTVVEDGILLNYSATQNYDYVLAIHYDFTWMKTTGRMAKANNLDSDVCYYIEDFNGPFNIFVEGYDLEDPYYTTDSLSKTVTLKEKESAGLEVSVMHTPSREYGYIRQIDLQNRGVIRPLRDYESPLVFVNGEAVHPTFGDIVYDTTEKRIYVPGVHYDQMWSVCELRETFVIKKKLMPVTPGTIGSAGETYILELKSKKDAYEVKMADPSVPGQYINIDPAIIQVTDTPNGAFIENKSTNSVDIIIYEYYDAFLSADRIPSDLLIKYDLSKVDNDDSLILFVQGLLVKKEDIIIDHINGTVTTSGLVAGQEYILLQDDFGWLYDEKKLRPALPVGKFVDSLVYFNGKLICNSVTLDTLKTMDEYIPVFNEVRCFKNVYLDASGNEIVNRDYRIWNIDTGVWDPLDQTEIDGITYFAYGYENSLKSVHILFPYNNTDEIQIYAFNTANSVEHPLFVKSVYVENQKNIRTDMQYIANKNTLRVWCNGIRQLPANARHGGITEYIDGMSFDLPVDDPYQDGSGNWHGGFTGKVTYAIELPENQKEFPCTMEILDDTSLKHGYINMYKVNQPLFPGRVTVYVNGIRLSTNDFTIQDNYTITIDTKVPLIGNWYNYPKETVFANNTQYEKEYSRPDVVLIEVREDERIERTFQCEGHPVYELGVDKYEIDDSILEPSDEIMVFVNGLYFGPTSLDGYVVNPAKRSITITQEDTLAPMNTDMQMQLLQGKPEEEQLYLLRHENKPYKQPDAIITMEWR